MGIAEAIDRLRMDAEFMANIAAWEQIPARAASYVDFPPGFDARLAAAVREMKTAPLFTHQAPSVKAALAGENDAVVTGTASGKTHCYTLPVLNGLLADPEVRAASI